MAEVHRARLRREPDRSVVVKRVLPAHRHDPLFRDLLLREAGIGARLRHPNLVRVFGTGHTVDEEPYIVMEYIDGIDVKRLAWSMRKRGVELPVWFAVHVVSEVLAGLAHAHGQVDESGQPCPIVHRDVSPENVLISRHGRIRLGDFGIAGELSRPQALTHGKLPYMAPEVFADREVDPRSDLFAVGVMLWELLTQKHLFRAGAPAEVVAQVCTQPRIAPSLLNPSVPNLLDRLVLSALDPQVERRPRSAAGMHLTLKRVLQIMHPEGPVSPRKVAPLVHDHLMAARLPSTAIDECPVEIEALVSESGALDDDVLITEPDDPTEPTRAAPGGADHADTTYAIIRTPTGGIDPVDPATPGKTGPNEAPRTEALIQAYLQDAPIPAQRSFVDTHDLAPSIVTVAPHSALAYSGPHPVWVDTPHGHQGPTRPARVFSYLQDQPAETLSEIRLSANGSRWIQLDRVAYLLDEELLPTTLELGSCEMRGRIADSSVTAVVGTFARQAARRRLVFVRPQPSGVERIEIELVGDVAVAIHQNEQLFETWWNLLSNPYLEERGLVSAFHSMLDEDRRLLPRVSPEIQQAIFQSRSIARRRSLDALFAWREGDFGTNAKVTCESAPGSVPVLRFLPRMVARRLPPDWVREQLSPHLEQPLWRAPEFDIEVNRLKLRRSERQRAEAFGHGRTLFESLEYANDSYIDTRYGQVIAYLLLELGLLHERAPYRAPYRAPTSQSY